MSTMADPHKVEDLIGTPFVYGGRGPAVLDCYGLIMEMYRRRLGIELPDYVSPSEQGQIAAIFGNQLQRWRKVPCARDTVVLIRLGRLASHCGYMIDDDRMVHSMEMTGGVTIQRTEPWQRRILGFYQYVG